MTLLVRELEEPEISGLQDLVLRAEHLFPRDPKLHDDHDALWKLHAADVLVPSRDLKYEEMLAENHRRAPNLFPPFSGRPIYTNRCRLVVAAIGSGEPYSGYPELDFYGGTLAGYFADTFTGLGIDEHTDYARAAPYFAPGSLFMQAMGGDYDRVYVFKPFRRQGIFKEMLATGEQALRARGFGNIELIPEEYLIPSLERAGYVPRDKNMRRWGKKL